MCYIVKDENTLGYIIKEYPTSKNVVINVLAVDYMAGGDPLQLDRTTIAGEGQIRDATKADADKFKIRISDPKTEEYKLMYRFGAWVTKSRIYAESDAEALHDAREIYEESTLGRWPYEVALWCGSRKVATLKDAEAGRYQTIAD